MTADELAAAFGAAAARRLETWTASSTAWVN